MYVQQGLYDTAEMSLLVSAGSQETMVNPGTNPLPHAQVIPLVQDKNPSFQGSI